MSDIAGPPVPNAVPAVAGTGRASGVSRDPQQQATTQGGEEKGDTRARGGTAEAAQVRDPAVSISATAAHLQVGDELRQSVARIDSEGRPIIVTETATFALRPDAGLKPGDDVVLQVVETGKTVAADLLVRNGRPVDPPERLNLIIIAVHLPDAPEGTGAATTGYAPPAGGPVYSRFTQAPQVGVSANTVPDTLAALIGSKLPLPPAVPASAPAADPAALGLSTDPLAARTSSSDLAALIAAQQQGRAPGTPGQYRNTTALVSPVVPTPVAPVVEPGHLLQSSALTELTAPVADAAAGLGTPIAAFTPEGAARQVQLIDASISRVPPHQVAEVLQVRQLAPDEARTLKLPLTALAVGALAQVETTKGALILPYAQAAPLAGELVKIGAPAIKPQAQAAQALPVYNARLTPPGTAQARAVQVQLPDPATMPADGAEARIKAVHTLRAFLTPDGPKTDFKLETTRGIVTLTLPHTVRPVAGDPVQIVTPAAPTAPAAGIALPLPAPLPPLAAEVPLPPAAAQATSLQATEAAAPAVPQPTVPLPAVIQALDTGWPALAAAQTLVAAHDPAVAASLVARDAGGGTKMTNSLLFFLNAVGRGADSWIGEEAARTLAARDHGLLDQLRQDIGLLARMAGDAPGEWRTALLPFDLKLPDMPFMALLFGPGMPLHPDRQQGGQPGEEGEADNGQRFVVEVRFSLLGAVQLDGLIRDRQFDLTLTSEKTLSPALKGDARQLFDAALGANGFTGRLTIHEAEAFPVQVDRILARRASEAAL